MVLNLQLNEEKKKIFENKDIIVKFVTNQIKQIKQKLKQIKTGEKVLEEVNKSGLRVLSETHEDNIPIL